MKILGKTFTGIIKYPNPAVDEAQRFRDVMQHALTKPLHKLAEPGGSVLPEGLKVSDLIDQDKMKSVTTLKLEHDPEKWGATTTPITDEWMRRIAATGCVHADDRSDFGSSSQNGNESCYVAVAVVMLVFSL